MGHQHDYYELLGVSPTAASGEIRRAFYRLVRKHPPEKDPEGYQKIRGAYETLSDEKAREEYDALWRFGPEIADLMDRADAKMSVGDFSGAAKLLKRVLVLNPYAAAAAIPLANCLVTLGDLTQAVKTVERVIKQSPDVPVYRIFLGNLLLTQAKELEYSEGRLSILKSARSNLLEAIKLDNQNVDPYLALADSYLGELEYDKALNWAEKAISADSRVDFQDFEALFFICQVHSLAGNHHLVLEVAKRIEDLIPDDADLRNFVADRFSQNAILLMQGNAFESALYFIRIAIKFDPYDQDLIKIEKDIELMHNASRCWSEFENDARIIPPVVSLATLILMRFSGAKIDGGFESSLNKLAPTLESYNDHQILESIRIMKNKYAPIYYIAPRFWQNFASAEPMRARRSGGAMSDERFGNARGCGCLSAVVFGLIGALIIPPIGIIVLGAIGWWVGNQIGRRL